MKIHRLTENAIQRFDEYVESKDWTEEVDGHRIIRYKKEKN